MLGSDIVDVEVSGNTLERGRVAVSTLQRLDRLRGVESTEPTLALCLWPLEGGELFVLALRARSDTRPPVGDLGLDARAGAFASPIECTLDRFGGGVFARWESFKGDGDLVCLPRRMGAEDMSFGEAPDNKGEVACGPLRDEFLVSILLSAWGALGSG